MYNVNISFYDSPFELLHRPVQERKDIINPSWSFLSEDYQAITPIHWLQYEPQSCRMHYLIAIIYTLIFIPGSLANMVMVTFFFRIPSLRTSTNLLNLNLAFADLLMNSQIPGVIYNSINCKPSFGVMGCKLHGFFSGWAGTVAIVTIAAMSVERYIKISKPFASVNFISFSSMIMVIVVIWLYGFIFASVPLFFESTITSYVPEGFLTTCSFDYLTHRLAGKIFIFIFFLAAYVIPLSVILFSYQSIISSVKRNRKFVIQGMLGSPQGKGPPHCMDSMKKANNREIIIENTSLCEAVNPVSSNASFVCQTTKSATLTLTPVATNIAIGSVMDVRMKYLQQQQKQQQQQQQQQNQLQSNLNQPTGSKAEEASSSESFPVQELKISLAKFSTNEPSLKKNGVIRFDSQERPMSVECTSFTSPPSSLDVHVVSNVSNEIHGAISSLSASLELPQMDKVTNETNVSQKMNDQSFSGNISSDLCANKNNFESTKSQINSDSRINSRKHSTTIHTPNGPISSASVRRYIASVSTTEKKLTKCSLVLISIWTIAWTPYAIVALIGIFSNASLLTPSASMFPAVLAKTASLLDPIFYSYSHPKYRELMRLQIRSVGRSICKPLGYCLNYVSFFVTRITLHRPYDARKSKVAVRRRSVIKRKNRTSKFSMEKMESNSNNPVSLAENSLNKSLHVEKQNKDWNFMSQSRFEREKDFSESRESTFSFSKSLENISPLTIPKDVVPKNVVPKNVVPKNVVPKNVVPKNVALHGVIVTHKNNGDIPNDT